jgi:hypothetical protein
MKVIGQSGNWYLIDLGGGQGRVLDLDFNRLFPPMSLASLIAKGGWEAFRGDQSEVLARADGATEQASRAEYV